MSLYFQDTLLHCASWPSAPNYGCSLDEGDDWTLLHDSIFTIAECESLCRQHASGDGCCFVSDAFGCYWKGGATVTKHPGDNAYAIDCTFSVPSEFHPITIIDKSFFFFGI